jgi:hypothetical protein
MRTAQARQPAAHPLAVVNPLADPQAFSTRLQPVA